MVWLPNPKQRCLLSCLKPPKAQFRPFVALALASRYLVTPSAALSNVSRLALLGLVLSVAILVIVLSVVNGFERELRERVLALLPQVSAFSSAGLTSSQLSELERLEASSEVDAVAGVVQDSVLLAANGQLQGANLLGIETSAYSRVTALPDYVVGATGASAGLGLLDQSRFGIILGQSLARKLQVSIGDELLVVLASASVTPAGVIPRQRRFSVVGLINSQSQLDSQFAYVTLETAQKLMRTRDRVHGVHVKARDLFLTRPAETLLYDADVGQTLRISNWQRNFGNLYQAIAVQKATMFVLLSFLVAVAAFNLVSGLMMIVEQRKPDTAILRTMGASFTTLLTSFVLLGFVLSFVGVLAGLLAGWLIATGLPGFYHFINSQFELELMTQYFISYLPVDVRSTDLLNIVLASMALTALAVVPPAVRAAGAEPSRVLAHE